MFKPEDMTRPEYPVFVKINGRIFSWFSWKGILALIVAAALAYGFNHFAAGFVRDVEVVKTDAEVEAELVALKTARDVVAYDAVVEELASLSVGAGVPRDDLDEVARERFYELEAQRTLLAKSLASMLTDETVRLRELAQELGITPDAADDELKALIQPTTIESVRIIPSALALIICAAMVLVTGLLVWEPEEGRSGWADLCCRYAFSRKQHEYFYRRISGYEEEESYAGVR